MKELVDSGSAWIGIVPSTWNKKPIRNIVVRRDGGAWGEEPFEDQDGTICMRVADFDYATGKFKDSSIDELTKRQYSEAQVYNLKLKKGDILIEKSGGGEKTPVGRTVIFDKEYLALFANFMDRIRINTQEVSELYVEYWLRALYACHVTPFYIKQTTGIQNLDLSLMLAKEKIFFPDKDNQNAITNYLDNRCGELDGLILDINEQIDELELYKRSVIIELTTKGLGDHVGKKDSGIEYVGQIPDHWDMHPLYVYFGERKHKNSLGYEDNLLSLSYGNIIQKDINTSDGLLPESFNTYNIIEPGDIIIRPTDLQNDKRSLRTGLSKEHGIITSAYIALKPIKNVNTAYYHYLLHAFDVMKVFYNMGNGVRQGLNFSEFSRLMVLEPPINEQNAIADYLDTKCTEIDKVISDKKEQLETIEEYKKSLIYEYVTGKKEVPVA